MLSLLVMQIVPVQAAMVGNGHLLQQTAQPVDREQIRSLFGREDVQQQFIALGVDAETAAARVDRLTDAEIVQINHRLSELPAGSGVLEILLIVFIVFVVTDVLGATDIFPFIRPVKN